MVERKNSLATALVNIPAVSMAIASLVLCDKTAHFRVAFDCLQHKVHLSNEFE